ncbi:MAG TPA: YicC/YloC family endoribonuclease [Terriglobales bacterium]|nr:YicC/YloC family endoribonuclease [Terriglobales bacterium]
MAIRSMTGFAQVKGQVATSPGGAALNYTVSLKSVNHRFLDLHLRLPSESDGLEMKLRRLLKEKLARGHVELTLSLEQAGADGFALNRPLVAGYIAAFRAAAREFGVASEPDLNVVLRLPGAMGPAGASMDEGTESAVLASTSDAIARLNHMREEEGRSMERELRERMARLREAVGQIEKLRGVVLRAHLDKLQTRMKELVVQADPDRLLQEAALLAERGDIQEELVRMNTHIDHFLGLLSADGEIGKKLDFLLQEMNREANTLLSKTSGVVGEALRLTELGLAMKSEVEKSREQAQNIE